MTAHGHRTEKCKHGRTVRACKCPAASKTVVPVPCVVCIGCGECRGAAPHTLCTTPSKHDTPERHQEWVWMHDEVQGEPTAAQFAEMVKSDKPRPGHWELRGTGAVA